MAPMIPFLLGGARMATDVVGHVWNKKKSPVEGSDDIQEGCVFRFIYFKHMLSLGPPMDTDDISWDWDWAAHVR
eukprot:CAMPEP_0184688362 /NCGR_PEP_ID=MMETSP0312-20130426/29624_1 /TAXON_ID=31354 /ORGANISM="Compsopogon coeruleus, Strain SAG 36.94" /LENGTH=73 /DNA_ID=CAMNT_0027145445 /DNA_START=48 /DNA_END=267 /DNA_ORIENTATION=-